MQLDQAAQVILNFDDGLRSVMDWFTAYKQPATIFVCPEWLELPEHKLKKAVPRFFSTEYKQPDSFLTWDACGKLLESGCEIGCHTLRHQDMAVLTEEEALHDMSVCKKLFNRRLGIDVELFAFPWHRIKHVKIVRRYFPRVRTVYGSGRFTCGLITMLVWHSGRSVQLKQWTECLLSQGIKFSLLGEQSDSGPFFEPTEEGAA